MIVIKAACEADIPLIKELAYTIWNIVYKQILSKDQLAYMLEKMHSMEALSKLMHDDHKFIIPSEYGVAKGYCCYKLYPEKVRIEKLYVLPQAHKKGIGKVMVNFVIEKISTQVNIMELNVNRHNNAVDFYKRLGFEIVKEVDIPIGGGYFMNDFVMQKKL